MNFPSVFIRRSDKLNTLENYVPSPMFRKAFDISGKAHSAEITICGLGFYRLFINGAEITKGILAPYVSNPDDIIYYDKYNLAPYLKAGKNALGIMLGNGMLNADGARIWDFDLATFRAAPMTAFEITYKDSDGEHSVASDESVKTADSACYYEDYRCGCFYDARNELDGWNTPEFDDSAWENAVICTPPKGEKMLCKAEPVTLLEGEKPVSIKAGEIADGYMVREDFRGGPYFESAPPKDGYIYDFSTNRAGVFTAKIKDAEAGTKISFQCAEDLDKDGKLWYNNILFYPDGYAQRDIYICRGGEETFTPFFTYHGFRYLMISGIAPEKIEICRNAVTSSLKTAGEFSCSNEIINKIQEIILRSDQSNFVYFPTDCPQREKHGWTGDAAISTEQFLYNFYAENSLKIWLDNIRKAQTEAGVLPGIVPTAGWGFAWGNGPAWDCVIQVLCDAIYRFSGDKSVIEENADALCKYIKYIRTRADQRGLVAVGLGDWLQPHCLSGNPDTPLEVTDSVMCYQIAKNASELFDIIGNAEYKAIADGFAEEMLLSIRRHLISEDGTYALCKTQTAQAIFMYYHIFEDDKLGAAAEKLVEFIKLKNNRIAVGLIGMKALFFALSDNGYADLAYDLIIGPEPSYAKMISDGLTSIPESLDYYERPEQGGVASLNHHFLGVVSAWFYGALGGIRFGLDSVKIIPCIPSSLDSAKASCRGITTEWYKENGKVILLVTAEENISGEILAPLGYKFSDGSVSKPLKTGTFYLSHC